MVRNIVFFRNIQIKFSFFVFSRTKIWFTLSVIFYSLTFVDLFTIKCGVSFKLSDCNYVISKCVMLISEMLSLAQQLYFYGNPARCPSLDTIENLAKLLPMIVQALWPKSSPLLQLPHITEQNLHHFRKVSYKTNILSVAN